MDIAVSDSDVLIHIAKLNLLNLLKGQFSKIIISEIVYNECVTQGISSIYILYLNSTNKEVSTFEFS